MTFADMLDERGMRQSQIARAAGLTRQRVNEWVRGVRDPRLMALGTARRVADALEMTIDEFESRLSRRYAAAPLGSMHRSRGALVFRICRC